MTNKKPSSGGSGSGNPPTTQAGVIKAGMIKQATQRVVMFFMALIQYGNGVAQKSGKEGGTVYSHNTYGSYTRRWAKPTDPQTALQMAQRNSFSQQSTSWASLTGAQRAAWAALASVTQFFNRLGQAIFLTGAALYNKARLNWASAGLPLLSDPAGWNVPVSLLTVAAAPDSVADTFDVTFTTAPVPAGVTFQIWATPQMSVGKTFDKRSKRHIANLQAAAASPEDIYAAYVAQFGDLVAGLKVQVWMRAIDRNSGADSPFIKVVAVVA